jgi:hypothetical protein
VVDAEDLALLEDRQHAAVELERLGQVGAERLLDDDPHLGVVDVVEAGLPHRWTMTGKKIGAVDR